MRTIEVVLYREKSAWVAQALNVEVSSFWRYTGGGAGGYSRGTGALL